MSRSIQRQDLGRAASRAALALALAAATAGSALPGCGPKHGRTLSLEDENRDFECKDRRAGYVAKGGLMYAEQGILISCEENVPKLATYTLTRDGARDEKGAVIRAGVWEEAWTQFDGAGWKYLDDCSNPDADPKDPVYTFVASDGDTTKTFTCPGTQLPFPYDRMRTGMDSLLGELSR